MKTNARRLAMSICPERSRIRRWCWAVAMACAFATTPALACPTMATRFEGKLREVRTEHPNGTPLVVLQLIVLSPVDAVGLEGECVKVRHIQIVPIDKATHAKLRQRIGKKVRIETPDLFVAHTAWHIGDAVAMKSSIAP